MPAFRFRLATFLRLREATRDERKAELAKAYRADAILAGREDDMQQEMRTLQQRQRKEVAPGAIDVDSLLGAQRYELQLRGQLAQLAHQRQLLAGEISRRQQALVEANREVRVLEKLRDKLAQRHRDEENYRQQRQLDETAQQRALREETAPWHA